MLGYNCYGMASYKVIQDVEAEDKLIGPLTLRQFIYAVIAALFAYLGFFFATHHAAFMIIVFLPISLSVGFLAFPWRRDQPTEVWALAKVRFMLIPRRRVWDQSGAKELVTITAPKQIAHSYTNNLSQAEVRSRLQALASTVDTRGWAVKNAGFGIGQLNMADDSDRLVGPTSLPKPVEDNDIRASDDIMDEQNNADAQRLKSMIDQSSRSHRDRVVESLSNNTPQDQPKPANYWFLNQPDQAAKIPNDMVTFSTQVVAPGTADDSSSAGLPIVDEANIVANLDAHKQQSESAYYGHMHTIRPLSEQQGVQPPIPTPVSAQPAMPPAPQLAVPVPPATQPAAPTQNASAPVTPAGRAAILQLANNDDLNVATLAREAERTAPQNEVVIKLH